MESALDIFSTQRSHANRVGEHLKPRHPFVPTAQQLISSSFDNNISAALWAHHRWNAERLDNTERLRTFIVGIGNHQ